MAAFIDLSGKRFGRLVVTGRSKINTLNGESRWVCNCDCGKTTVVRTTHLRGNKTLSCGCLAIDLRKSAIGARSHMWKGGRKRTPSGYVYVYAPDHANAAKDGYVFEHIKIMSDSLGRPLRKGETVHHINEIRDDNHVPNLELRSSRHGPGQRIDDLVLHAIGILCDYPDVATNIMKQLEKTEGVKTCLRLPVLLETEIPVTPIRYMKS